MSLVVFPAIFLVWMVYESSWMARNSERVGPQTTARRLATSYLMAAAASGLLLLQVLLARKEGSDLLALPFALIAIGLGFRLLLTVQAGDLRGAGVGASKSSVARTALPVTAAATVVGVIVGVYAPGWNLVDVLLLSCGVATASLLTSLAMGGVVRFLTAASK
ncbi:hypothetical protein [Aeromicrobium alkaliterrae]|uniref:DUF1453 domain-containing protein n=1 Tax=Aeromicrobium alkaliterrae TaxID=302168 RepID=A0ABP4WBT2_9ACTN